jgi:ATP citrate (pro-S)-lyase
MHPVAVQSMLDFDHLCGRKQPSVSAIVYPFAGAHYRKFFWGSQEIMISVMPSLAEIFAKNPSSKVQNHFVHQSLWCLVKQIANDQLIACSLTRW